MMMDQPQKLMDSRTIGKYVCLFFLFLLAFEAGYAQLTDTVYIGTATLNDGGLLTYKLQINDSAGVLTGYSVTDVNGPDETKASITGTVSSSGNQIVIKELSIIYSKSKSASPDFCIMQGSLKVKTFKGTKLLKGHFEGYLNGGKTLCASGKLVLISPKDVFKILGKSEEEIDSATNRAAEKDNEEDIVQYRETVTKASEKATALAPVIAKDTEMVQPAIPEKKEIKINPVITYEAPPKNVLKVLPGKTIEINAATNMLTLEVWDNKDIDGDIITLMQGDKALIKNYTLTGTHFSVPVDMGNKPTDTLHLIAVSEGSEPLNTARIKITSGNDFYFIDATTTIDKEVLIVLKRTR